MASPQQKEFNRFMDNYINGMPRTKIPLKERLRFSKKKPEMDKAELIEDQELVTVEEVVNQGGVFARIFDALFGSKAEVEPEDFSDEEIEEVIAEEQVGEAEEKEQPLEERKTPGFLKRILWGGHEEAQEDIDVQEVQKVVLYKSRAERDAKVAVHVAEAALKKLDKDAKSKLKQSPVFGEYELVKKRHYKK